MKLEIMGFNQNALTELGLGLDDAAILRWFVDYQGTRRMKAIVDTETGKSYWWVNFKKVCEDLPIVTGSDRYMARRFGKLEDAGLLEKYATASSSGKISAFRLAEDGCYISLIAMSPNSDMAHVTKSAAMSPDSDMPMSPDSDMPCNNNNLPSNNNSVDNLLGDNYCPELPESGTPDQSPAVFQMPLNDKTNYKITQEQIDKWTGLYPAVDVMQQIRNMIGWLEGNPSRRKTRSGVMRFINNWLSKEQDKGRRYASKPIRTPVSNAAFEGQQGGEITW